MISNLIQIHLLYLNFQIRHHHHDNTKKKNEVLVTKKPWGLTQENT